MKIEVDEALIDHLAFLSGLTLSTGERTVLRVQLHRIFGYMARIDEMDSRESEDIRDQSPAPLREDLPGNPLPRDEILDLAPASDRGFLQMPRIRGPGSGKPR